jgi:predicted RNA-binding Zn-ribbon protein involved in translation (DUF1610 family)
VKIVVQVKLLPTPDEALVLAATLHAVNAGANLVSAVAFEQGVTSRNDLQKLVYGRLKAEFGLGAQAAVRTVKKVVDAYAALRAQVRAGRLGAEGAKRPAKATSKPVVFREDAAQPFDDRILSWQHDAGTVSIWTTSARLKLDAAYTPQMCPRCGHTERNNRPTRGQFCCRRCGLAGPADVVAGVNVRNRARSAWVLVNGPALQGA